MSIDIVWCVSAVPVSGTFRGAASAYAQHRARYPSVLFDELKRRSGVTANGRLLDVACGTGEVALALSESFESVLGIDAEQEMIAEARAISRKRDVQNITWICARAERTALEPSFDLITVGNAFHHFDRPALARQLVSLLSPDGCLCILGTSSVLAGPEVWKQDLFDVVQHFHPGLARPVGSTGWAGSSADSIVDVLARVGFSQVKESIHPVAHRFSVDALLAYLHTTWFGSPGTLGARAEAFDRAVIEATVQHELATGLDETIEFYSILGSGAAQA